MIIDFLHPVADFTESVLLACHVMHQIYDILKFGCWTLWALATCKSCTVCRISMIGNLPHHNNYVVAEHPPHA